MKINEDDYYPYTNYSTLPPLRKKKEKLNTLAHTRHCYYYYLI